MDEAFSVSRWHRHLTPRLVFHEAATRDTGVCESTMPWRKPIFFTSSIIGTSRSGMRLKNPVCWQFSMSDMTKNMVLIDLPAHLPSSRLPADASVVKFTPSGLWPRWYGAKRLFTTCSFHYSGKHILREAVWGVLWAWAPWPHPILFIFFIIYRFMLLFCVVT